MAMNYGFEAQGDRDSDVYCMFSFAPQSPFLLNLNYGTIPNGDLPTQARCSHFWYVSQLLGTSLVIS